MEPCYAHNYSGVKQSPVRMTISSSSAIVLKFFIPVALSAALQPKVTGAKVISLNVPSLRERTEDSFHFTARRRKTIEIASISRKRRTKKTPASRFTSEPRNENLEAS